MLNITDISTKKKLFFMYVNILSKDTDSHMKWYFIFSVYWLIPDYISDQSTRRETWWSVSNETERITEHQAQRCKCTMNWHFKCWVP